MQNQQNPNNLESNSFPESEKQPPFTNQSDAVQTAHIITPGSQNIPGPVSTVEENTNQNRTFISNKKLLSAAILIVLVLIGGGVAAMKLVNNKSPVSNGSASNQDFSRSIQWIKYNDPTLGFTFSYPKGWRISDSNNTKEPSGRTIYISPTAVNTDPETLKQKHLDDPELGFYIYNTNPMGNLDNQPVESPDEKVGTITLANGKQLALIESQYTSYDNKVTLSACPDTLCIFKINNKFLSPTIRTLGSRAGLDGYDLDKTGSIYKTELKILESINY